MMERTIIDLSEANGVVDWAQAAAHINGAILRAGYRGYGRAGTLVTDRRWEANTAGCAAHGVPFGAYWVSQAISTAEAVAEAEYVHGLLAGKSLSLPVFLDSEWGEALQGSGRADRLTSVQRTAFALAFLRKLRDDGHKTGLYTGVSWFREQIDGEAIRADGHSIWLASVEHVEPPMAYDGWQYSWRGRVPGVGTEVDMSRFVFPADGADWSAEARRWAVAQGLFQGDATGDFDWGGAVTREQLAVILKRYNEQDQEVNR